MVESIAAYGGAIDPGDSAADGEIVDQIAGVEVVGAVQDQVRTGHQFGDIGGGEVGNYAARLDGRIDAAQGACGGGGFGQGLGGVGFFEQPLALQVAGFHVVAVDDGQAADSRAGQRGGMEAAQRAGADDGGMCAEQRFLAVFAQTEENLPGIALPFGGAHAGCPSHGSRRGFAMGWGRTLRW